MHTTRTSSMPNRNVLSTRFAKNLPNLQTLQMLHTIPANVQLALAAEALLLCLAATYSSHPARETSTRVKTAGEKLERKNLGAWQRARKEKKTWSALRFARSPHDVAVVLPRRKLRAQNSSEVRAWAQPLEVQTSVTPSVNFPAQSHLEVL